MVSGVVKLDDPFSGFSSSPFVRSSGLGAGSGNLRKSGRGRSDPLYSRVVVVAPGSASTHCYSVLTTVRNSSQLTTVASYSPPPLAALTRFAF